MFFICSKKNKKKKDYGKISGNFSFKFAFVHFSVNRWRWKTFFFKTKFFNRSNAIFQWNMAFGTKRPLGKIENLSFIFGLKWGKKDKIFFLFNSKQIDH